MTNGADLSFVNLGITIEHLPKSISVFGFEDPEIYLDFALYAIVFSIIGARIYYVVFDWDAYKDNLLQIFNLRAGGLAIYGGVIGAVLTLIVFTKIKKLSFFSMADTGVLGLILGQIIGRWGNFFNCEAFGGYTDNLFAMRIKMSKVNLSMISQELLDHKIVEQGVEYIQVHPTFLYESLWNLGVLLFMLWYRKRKAFDGEMLCIYLLGYGLGRALSLVLVVCSAAVLIGKHRKLAAARRRERKR